MCSESTGTIRAPVASASAVTSSPPTTSDSLLASARSIPSPSVATVGPRPTEPTSAFSTSSAPDSTTSRTSPSAPREHLAVGPRLGRPGGSVLRRRGRCGRRRGRAPAPPAPPRSLRRTSPTSSSSSLRAHTSSACMPIDPVEPRISRRRRLAELLTCSSPCSPRSVWPCIPEAAGSLRSSTQTSSRLQRRLDAAVGRCVAGFFRACPYVRRSPRLGLDRRLAAATNCCTVAPFGTLGVSVAAVELVSPAAGLVGPAVLELEPPLLPQPARSVPPTTAMTSPVVSLAVIHPPWQGVWCPQIGRRAPGMPAWATRRLIPAPSVGPQIDSRPGSEGWRSTRSSSATCGRPLRRGPPTRQARFSRTLSSVLRNRIDRQIDDVLLATAVSGGFLYTRRRVRRAARTLARGTALVGVGAAGVGALGVAGAAAWYRRRSKSA